MLSVQIKGLIALVLLSFGTCSVLASRQNTRRKVRHRSVATFSNSTMSLPTQISSTLSIALSQTFSTSNFSVPVASPSPSSSNMSITDITVSTTTAISSSISSTYQSTSVSSPSGSASSSGPSSNSTISSGSTISSDPGTSSGSAISSGSTISSTSTIGSSSAISSDSTISFGSVISSSAISSGPSTGSGSTTQSAPGISSFTDLPPFTVPTVTLTAGPEETSEAVKVAPILWYLWQKKSSLQDQEHKQEYIDDVKKSRDDFVVLFNQLDVKPPSKPECKQTSLAKRSLISSIIDTFKGVEDLISCGVDVLNNLVDTVQVDEPSISEVDLLTDTLKDIGDELDKQGDEPSSSAQSSESPTSSSSSISSSCTITITKTWESVLCTVTATPSANQKRQDQSCTTQVYSTVTGCSVIDSTTTSITTVTPGATPIPQCSFESCGTGSTCPNKKRSLEKRLPPRLSQPETNSWASPENYGGNNQDFMAGEVGLIYMNEDDFNQRVNLVQGTTSKYISFLGSPGSLAVSGLYGCTSVIAVSKRGAWVSHMWEVPSFTPARNNPAPPTDLEQLDIFRQQDLMALHSGSGNDHLFGLAQLRDSSAGDDQPLSHLMDDDTDPHVFIFAPYVRATSGTPNYGNEFPVGLPEAFGQDDGLPSKNQQIENEVKAIFRISNSLNVPYEKVVYAPRVWQDPLVQEDLSDENYDSHRGKVLVQYQPAKSCQEKASWRVWFEGHELQDSQQSEWAPLANQIAINPQGAVKGRQEPTGSAIACPLPSSTSSGSSSSTSQPPPSTSDPTPSTISPSATESLTLSPSSIESLTLSPSTTETSTIETTPTESLTTETTPIEIPTSTATTEPTPTPTSVTTPLQVFDIACNNEAEFPGHGDVSQGAQHEFAVEFSGLDGPDGSEFISSTTPTLERKFEDKHGISYDYSVSWVSGCVTTVDKQSFRYPLAEGDTDVLAGEPARVTAYGLLRAVYTDCNNQGVGGKRQVGCLEYVFTGAK